MLTVLQECYSAVLVKTNVLYHLYETAYERTLTRTSTTMDVFISCHFRNIEDNLRRVLQQLINCCGAVTKFTVINFGVFPQSILVLPSWISVSPLPFWL